MTEQEFIDKVKNISREVYEEAKSEGADVDAGLSEQITEEVSKQIDEWESKTSDQRKEALRDLQDELRDPDSAATKRNKRSVFEKDLRGPGSLVAKALPFFSEVIERNGGGTPDLREVRDMAQKGIPDSGFQSKEVAESINKFLNSGETDAGGGFVPEPTANDFIEFLYDTTVVRRAGARSIELPTGGVKIPTQSGSVSANWGGEADSAQESEPSFGFKRLEADKLTVMVVLTNDLVRRSPRGVEQLVMNDMRQRAMVEEDYAFLMGDGNDGTPTGIYKQTHADNKFERSTDSGNVTIDTITRDALKAIYKVEAANIAPQTPGWVMHPRTARYLMSLRGQDSYIFTSQLSQGSFLGAPVHMTNALPTNLDDSGDATNDETRMIYGDFSQCLIGDTLNLQVVSSQQATVNISNEWRSLLQDDLRAVVLRHEVGFMLRRDKSFSIVEGVDYGASFDA